MGSRKRSALKRQRDAFDAELGSMDDVFAREEKRQENMAEQREAAMRHKACGSKNRYATRIEAEGVAAESEAYSHTKLYVYRCAYCNGWHLTSHPREK